MRDGFASFGVQSSSVWETIGDNQSHEQKWVLEHMEIWFIAPYRAQQMIAQEIVYVEDSNIELLDSQVGL